MPCCSRFSKRHNGRSRGRCFFKGHFRPKHRCPSLAFATQARDRAECASCNQDRARRWLYLYGYGQAVLNGGAGCYRPSVTVSKARDALAIVKADKTSSIPPVQIILALEVDDHPFQLRRCACSAAISGGCPSAKLDWSSQVTVEWRFRLTWLHR